MTEHESDMVIDVLKVESTRARHCEACGALVHVHLDMKAPLARWGEVWFCDQCLRALAADKVAHIARETALRGVPLS
jgi:hypothetical protein